MSITCEDNVITFHNLIDTKTGEKATSPLPEGMNFADWLVSTQFITDRATILAKRTKACTEAQNAT